MNNHINICEDEETIPSYAIIDDNKICGFFGWARFLSNFYLCPMGIWWEGIKYPSVEHAYQAAKFPQQYRKDFSLDTCTSGQSKRLAKKLIMELNLDPEPWDDIKLLVMSNLVFQKFSLDENFRGLLHDTGDAYLEETNNWGDIYWGVYNGKGHNHLGKILIQTREFIWRV